MLFRTIGKKLSWDTTVGVRFGLTVTVFATLNGSQITGNLLIIRMMMMSCSRRSLGCCSIVMTRSSSTIVGRRHDPHWTSG